MVGEVRERCTIPRPVLYINSYTYTCTDQLTHCDVVEPVKWFVSCSDTHCNRMIFLTTLKRLEKIMQNSPDINMQYKLDGSHCRVW